MRLRKMPNAEAVLESSPYVIKEPEKLKGRWQEATGGRPLRLELGTGKGMFLMELAKRQRDVFFVGIELYDSVLFRAAEKMEGKGADEGFAAPDNLLFICMDVRRLPEVFEPGEVEYLYLNFSDPWPKARHAKRRLTSENFLGIYDKVLKKGGGLQFKTDNKDLFEFSVESIGGAEGWRLTDITRDLHGDAELSEGNVMTEYERKFTALGSKICMLRAVYE